MKVSVIIPAYNEEKFIAKVITMVKKSKMPDGTTRYEWADEFDENKASKLKRKNPIITTNCGAFQSLYPQYLVLRPLPSRFVPKNVSRETMFFQKNGIKIRRRKFSYDAKNQTATQHIIILADDR